MVKFNNESDIRKISKTLKNTPNTGENTVVVVGFPHWPQKHRYSAQPSIFIGVSNTTIFAQRTWELAEGAFSTVGFTTCFASIPQSVHLTDGYVTAAAIEAAAARPINLKRVMFLGFWDEMLAVIGIFNIAENRYMRLFPILFLIYINMMVIPWERAVFCSRVESSLAGFLDFFGRSKTALINCGHGRKHPSRG